MTMGRQLIEQLAVSWGNFASLLSDCRVGRNEALAEPIGRVSHHMNLVKGLFQKLSRAAFLAAPWELFMGMPKTKTGDHMKQATRAPAAPSGILLQQSLRPCSLYGVPTRI